MNVGQGVPTTRSVAAVYEQDDVCLRRSKTAATVNHVHGTRRDCSRREALIELRVRSGLRLFFFAFLAFGFELHPLVLGQD
jgi:hypothetical protein